MELPPPDLLLQAGDPVISVRDLVHRYPDRNKDRTALNGISFEVRAAELFGLLGPNGSGKTTLFRILSTLMLPSAGAALVAGVDAVREPAALRRRIGVVFQAQSVDPKLTAYENLWHQGHLYGLRGSALKKRIEEILTRVGLLDRAKDRLETFSGGMQRRIELAKGLLHHPEVLLLDEPTTGLDPGARRDRIRDKFHVDTSVMNTHVRLEIENGHRFVPDVVEAFPGEILALSVSKPTLEDVFIHRTGHRFWNEEVDSERKEKKKKH